MKPKYKLLSLLTLLPLAVAAPAQTAPTVAPTSLDPLVVTGTRTEVLLKDVPASLSVVSRATLELTQPAYAGLELIGVPGITVKETYGGTFTNLVFRGVPNRHLNDTFIALVDGVPYVNAGDETNLDHLPFDAVDRVEVLKGTASALYGRGGVAGAVNYITFNPAEARQSRIEATFGSDDNRIVSGRTTVPLGGGGLLLAGSYQKYDGWRDRTERENFTLFAKGQWKLAPATTLTAALNLKDHTQHYASHLPVRADGSLLPVPGGRERNFQTENARNINDVAGATVTLAHDFNRATQLRFTASQRRVKNDDKLGFHETFDETALRETWNGFHARSTNNTGFLEAQLTLKLAAHRLIMGASHEQQERTSREDWTGAFGFNPTTFAFDFYAQIFDLRTGQFTNRASWITEQLADVKMDGTINALYVQDEWTFAPRWKLTVGARHDHFERDAKYRATPGGGTNSTAADDDQYVSPKAALSHQFTGRLTGYVSYGEGFSPAFGPAFVFENRDPRLKPEKSRNLEAGLKGVFADGRLAVNSSVYVLNRRDLLQVLFEGATSRSFNVGEQESRGIEFEARADLARVHEGLGGWLSYAYTQSKWIDNRFVSGFPARLVNLSGKRVTGVPTHAFSVGMQQNFRRLGLTGGLWADYYGDYYVTGNNTVRKGAYGLVNANVAWSPSAWRGVRVTLYTRNLLDKEYYNYLGNATRATEAFAGQGREFRLSLGYEF